MIPFQRQALHEPERVASLRSLELLRCGRQKVADRNIGWLDGL